MKASCCLVGTCGAMKCIIPVLNNNTAIALTVLVLHCCLVCIVGDVACDMYHKYPEDFKTMQQMGVKHYR